MPTWIRVKDKRTRHQYDVDERAFREDLHERLNSDRYPDLSGPGKRPRPAKPHVPRARSASAEGTTTAQEEAR